MDETLYTTLVICDNWKVREKIVNHIVKFWFNGILDQYDENSVTITVDAMKQDFLKKQSEKEVASCFIFQGQTKKEQEQFALDVSKFIVENHLEKKALCVDYTHKDFVQIYKFINRYTPNKKGLITLVNSLIK